MYFGSFWRGNKDRVREQINDNDELKQAEQSFIDLGRRRNLLVHENFAEFDVNITVEEIYLKYQQACYFISLIETV